MNGSLRSCLWGFPLFNGKRYWGISCWGLSSNKIASETGLEKRRVLRALNRTREVMLRDIPGVFEGTVEVDETYIGGQWRNKRKAHRVQGTKRGRGTSKQPVFGILCRHGYVWAEIVPGVDSETLVPLINKRVRRGSIIYSDTWRGYTGIAAKGYVHRLVRTYQRGVLRYKGHSHQWTWRILGISQEKSCIQRWYSTRASSSLSGRICMAF